MSTSDDKRAEIDMAVCEKHHKELTDGVGKCSRAMWRGGFPDGFCDADAYGPQEPGQQRSGDRINGRFCASYVPFLACYHHGGPKAPGPHPSPEDKS